MHCIRFYIVGYCRTILNEVRVSTKTPVESLRKGLEILEILSSSELALTLADIAARMNLKRTTTHNLLKTLCLCGYALNHGDGRYAPGPRLAETARRMLAFGPPDPRLLRIVTDASVELNEAVVLTAFVLGHRRVVARARGSQLIQIAADALEERDRRHWETVTGRVLAAHCDADELATIIAQEGYPGSQWDEIDCATQLEQALSAIRELRLAEAQEHAVVSYAVPIISETGVLLGAIGSHLPEFRCQPEIGDRVVCVLRRASERLALLWRELICIRSQQHADAGSLR